MNSTFLHLLAISLLLAVVACDQQELNKLDETRPNIIIILADDMGFSDIGCYGGEIPTPAIDSLAANGLRFTQFYNTARCCPTRASLLTGLHPHQTGIGHMTRRPDHPEDYDDWGTPGYRGFLNRSCLTAAELLKTAGYRTYMTGKWHLGVNNRDRWPLQRGFDKFYGILSGACSYFKPQGKRGLTYQNDTLPPPKSGFYTTDVFTDSAIAFISEESSEPFFLYLAYNAPHWPLHAKEEDIELFRNKYASLGWDDMRRKRLTRQKRMGIFPQTTKLSTRDSLVRKWVDVDAAQKDRSDYRMATYAAQVYRMDKNIGRLITHLQKVDQLDNTFLIFLSDNGACAEPYNEFGGQQVTDINDPAIWWNVSIGRGWANACNTPLSRYKSMTYEGGIATPLIIHWPKQLKHLGGNLIQTPSYLIDVMPSLIELAQTEYPSFSVNGDSLFRLQGKSLLPVILGKKDQLHDYMYWEHQNNAAIRKGNWKAIRPGTSQNWELYDLSVDRTEESNLATSNVEIVVELKEKWHTWAVQNQVLPKRVQR